jgi:hypothetical protein
MTMTLPAPLESSYIEIVSASEEVYLLPALIVDAGEKATKHFLEFFTVTIRNPHTRRAYGRACMEFRLM